MDDEATEQCVGCAAVVPRITGPVHQYMTSAPGCWALWGELNARLLSDTSTAPYRQLIVDTYAVQHPGTPGPQAIQSVAIHLMSLYAQLDRGFPSDRIPGAFEPMLRVKGGFHWLSPPSFAGALNVVDVVGARRDLEAQGRTWARSVWRAWAPHHAQVKLWFEQAMRTSALRKHW
jgi:hypothetical protein